MTKFIFLLLNQP